MQHTEAMNQEALFAWAEVNKRNMPELANMFAVPNGGKRNAREAYWLKRTGVKAGVPDIFLAAAHGGSHGLFIELKSEKGRISEHQAEWIERLTKAGYACAVCFGWEEAARTITQYIRRA